MGVPPVAVRHIARRRRRPRGGQPYNPLTAFDWKAAFWAGDPLWTPPADGDPVSSWRDGGSEGKNATQATGTKQPAYRASVAALNDQPAIQGDGVDDFLQTAAWSSALSQPGTIVVVGNYGTAAGGPALVDGNAATGRWRVVADSGNYRIHAGTAVDGSALSVDVGLYVATFGSPDTLDFNGSQVVSGNAGTGVMGGVTIGAYASTGLGNHTGHYAFVGVIAGDVTAEANWPAFVAWVETHYGITVA